MDVPATPDLERARRVRDLFDQVADLDPSARRARLDAAQRTDTALVEEVRGLLAAYDRADRVLERLEGSADADPHGPGSLEVGQTVSHYRVLGRLGAGGMGVVYRAEDTRLRRPVALKFLPPDLTRDSEARERLLREARAAGALDHPHLCTVHEAAETEAGEVFIAMACYEGETLRERIARGPLPVAEAVEIAIQTASGLAAAHAAGLVHRDVKPANVFVTEQSGVRLLDFGLARGTEAGPARPGLTRPGVTPGTVAYMSPEQAAGDAVDARTDLWALGVVLYEMLDGQRPFRGDRDAAVLAAIRESEPEPICQLRPEVPTELARVVARLLQKDPEARYASAAEVVSDLHAVRDGQPLARRRIRTQSLVWTGVTATLVALVALLGVLARGGGDVPVDSVAVLPVVNLSGDPEQEYFADGMTDLLINQLSRIGGFDRVIARSSVMRYKESEKTPQQIGRELGVERLVEASALREGERVRINASLIEVESGRAVWSRSFERPLRDVLTLQREVAQEIVESMGVVLAPQDRARLAEAPVVDPEAFDLYVRGTQIRYRMSLEAHREAEDYFTRAVAIDPTYAPAHAGLAWVLAFLGEEAQARASLETALSQDPRLAEAHITLGLMRQFYDWDWAGAAEALREARRLDPGYAETHHELGMLLMRWRQSEEAVRAAQRALYLSPMSARYQSGVAEVLAGVGRYEEAIVAAEKALALDSTYKAAHGTLWWSYLALGRYPEALEAWERCGTLSVCPRGADGFIGYIYAVTDRQEDAQRVIDELKESDSRLTAHSIAHVYVGLGEKRKAIDWLERAVDARSLWVLYFKIDPVLHALDEDPRYQALLRRVGLAEAGG